jgi:hypothetical protein
MGSSPIQSHGLPRTIEHLDHHSSLGFDFRRAKPVWLLKDGGRIVDRMVAGTSLNRMASRRCRDGSCSPGDFHARDDIAEGRLADVLGDASHGNEEEIHALCLGGQRMPLPRFHGLLAISLNVGARIVALP